MLTTSSGREKTRLTRNTFLALLMAARTLSAEREGGREEEGWGNGRVVVWRRQNVQLVIRLTYDVFLCIGKYQKGTYMYTYMHCFCGGDFALR